jgi:hypothetical protein
MNARSERADGDSGGACAVVELRRYALHPGRRDSLIDLFEREFVESQEACGMRLLGQFRELDDADRFVWLRGFPDIPRRAQSLASFYGGPVWRAHREAANATMVDSDDVLLLRPVHADAGFVLDHAQRVAVGAAPRPGGLVVAMIWSLQPRSDAEVVDALDGRVAARLRQAGAARLACFVSEHAPNTFPALPVREGENVFACFAGFDDASHWQRHGEDVLRAADCGTAQVLRLTPTARSLVRGGSFHFVARNRT